ncbi:hypothetical protein [Dulcicalothrix desertica]|nr:hypothetical protein [Dulcicalothrix desertica]
MSKTLDSSLRQMLRITFRKTPLAWDNLYLSRLFKHPLIEAPTSQN